ncbi:unnamed protein product [Camellia sinensis]
MCPFDDFLTYFRRVPKILLNCRSGLFMSKKRDLRAFPSILTKKFYIFDIHNGSLFSQSFSFTVISVLLQPWLLTVTEVQR